MNKLNALIRSVIGMLVLSFFTLIVFVSVLGENHRINFLVTNFFDDLKNGDYNQLCPLLDLPANGSDECMDQLFFLELSMLSRFKLLEKEDYTLVITRDHFWIPFLTSDRVKIGIAMTDKKKNMFEEWMARFESNDRIEGFMSVERRGGQWVIEKIRFNEPALATSIDEMKNSVDVNRYIVKTEKGYALQPNEINFKALTTAEKRLFEYSLRKISGQNSQNKN
ncbi:MAG: hypothetical protein WC799_12815 [Desulfobacteraceae bacterium]|jgi:hypothetical protein